MKSELLDRNAGATMNGFHGTKTNVNSANVKRPTSLNSWPTTY